MESQTASTRSLPPLPARNLPTCSEPAQVGADPKAARGAALVKPVVRLFDAAIAVVTLATAASLMLASQADGSHPRDLLPVIVMIGPN